MDLLPHAPQTATQKRAARQRPPARRRRADAAQLGAAKALNASQRGFAALEAALKEGVGAVPVARGAGAGLSVAPLETCSEAAWVWVDSKKAGEPRFEPMSPLRVPISFRHFLLLVV